MKTIVSASWIMMFSMAVLMATETNLPTQIVVDGVTYENVRWKTVTPVDVTIFHRSGVAAIPLWELPKELQERFGYDPQKTNQFISAVRATRAEHQRQTAQRIIANMTSDDMRWRLVNGTTYDFYAAIQWHKEFKEWRGKLAPVIVGGYGYERSIGGGLSEQHVSPEQQEASEHMANVRKEEQKWKSYLVKGKVISIAADGIFLERNKVF